MIFGVLVVIPIVFTYFVFAFVIRRVDKAMAPLVTNLIVQFNLPLPEDFHLPGLGFILIFTMVFLVGLFASNIFGNKIVKWGESYLNRIPFVRVIYISIKHLMEAISQSDTQAFKKFSMVDFPKEGTRAFGLVSKDTTGELAFKIGSKEFQNIFIPCTPNPTTGFLLFVPKNQVTVLSVPPEEGIKSLLSLGTVSPEQIREREKEKKQEEADSEKD